MHSRSYPVLDEAEDALVDAFLVGLDRPTARVLAYLLARAEEHDAGADRLAVRVGTGLGRARAADALSTLEARGLATRSTAPDRTSGRPPERWRVAVDRDDAAARVRTKHAESLLERARAVAEGLEPTDEGQPRATGVPPESSALRVCLNWEPNGLQAPLFLAAGMEAFRDEGLDVRLAHRYGSRAALDAVVAGDADVGVAGAATLLRARARDDPVVPVALWSRRALAVLYTTREAFGGRFGSVEQLRGRRIATTTDSETGILGRLLLSQADLLADVTLVHVEGEEQTALLDGRADAATGVVTDPDALASDHEVNTLSVADHFPVPGPALVVRRETLDGQDETLVGFLAALLRGWTSLREDPAAAARTVAAHSDVPADAERRRIDAIADRFADDVADEHGWGCQSAETWRRLETALAQSGLLEGDR